MSRENYIYLRTKWVEFQNQNLDDVEDMGEMFRDLDSHFGVDGATIKVISNLREDIEDINVRIQKQKANLIKQMKI